MRVWIDQDLCTGDGLCLDHAPDVFLQLEDGIAYLPALVWLVHRCTWPTCDRMPAPDGRMFLGGRLCTVHTDESRERDAAALDEIECARRCSR